MKVTKRQLKRIVQEMANQEQDFVVGGYSGGYSSDSERYDYIVSAINKNDAKKKLKDAKPFLKKLNAAPVTDYTELDPYSTFERLGESANFGRETQMKITKRQLKRIIREERTRLSELGIDRMTSGDRDPRLEDGDDMSLGEETLAKMVSHLQALNDLVTSEAGQRTIGGKKEVEQIKALLPWAQNYLEYWRS